MRIEVPVDAIERPGFVAYLVKCTIEGLARGYAPLFAHWHLPGLYESGVRFALEPAHGTGFEDFALPHDTLARGAGDCDDLVIYRLSQLYAAGENGAACHAQWLPTNEIHVLVRRANGDLEDPSILLGAPT